MPSTSFKYYSTISKTAEKEFRVETDMDGATHLTLVSETALLNNGDPVSIEMNGSSLLTVVYRGTVAGGIILEHTESSQYYLFSDTLYSYDAIATMTEEPYPVCFVKGTLITTDRGHVAIENLVVGDRVQGSTGWRTVKWVGWRNYGATSFLTEESHARIAPVRIHAHAIAANVPSKDLLTSAWHHLFVQGKLVRAGDLINDTTITQETHVREVSYYHVELDQFDIIMAHGMYSESWADGGNRDFFQNVDITSLRPEDMKRRKAPRPGFDHLVLRKGKTLAAIQQDIAARATVVLSIQSQTEKAA
jgi:hypothetical protein